ncbi:Pkinase domain-containing protein [Cephalotus follicularis]|uniref:non-specific serine/threonine protein kinase n=1 Tax=Cephalotus follicularis TaxID=3775 RepID=A0A1Q3B3V2_CEPFO|nr:Pkinase domain-containing protein [Cephalotus follicularis]
MILELLRSKNSKTFGLKKMKLRIKLVVICFIFLIWIQQCLCVEQSHMPGINNWTCTCSSSYHGNESSVLKFNCSTSCDCSPGSLKEKQASKNHIAIKFVVIILLLCVILTTFAFLASLVCYVHQKEKCNTQLPVFSSDNETSCHSATKLISHKTSVPKTVVNIGSPINPITGCFRKATSICQSNTGTIYGTIIQFSYYELEYATDKFSSSNLIGLGGSSYVYRGRLKDGRTVAVKKLKTQGGPDADSVFSREVELLSRLHHCHVVPLIGYCSQFQGKSAERLLIFEYMPNGNLRDCLDGVSGENMNWDTRATIAIGVARGLEYLHEAAAPRILHRDIKSSNILLDDNWRAKITDLGMAKRIKADGIPSCSSSPARMQGTFGYFAPECAIIGRASLMSDVFSFGVVLLELITGRQPIHKSINKGEESLVIWSTPRLQDSSRVIVELPDPRLKGNFPEEELQIMAYLAKECLLLDPDARPTMSEVVQILSTIAPDKSKRRYFPANLLQMTNTSSMRSEPYIQKPDDVAGSPVEAEKLRQATSVRQSACKSQPLDIDHTLCVENQCKKPDSVPTEHMERLILLTSKASWLAHDDETVDLTEPRFESFITNVKSP